jgi:hypothetical protein
VGSLDHPSAMSSNEKRIVAIVGATGAVGEVLLQVLAERRFPVGELRPLASERSAGTTVRFDGRDLPVELARADALDGADFVFFAATGTLSKDLAPEAARRGAIAIDESSAWRMDTKVSLVVPEVNSGALDHHRGHRRLPQLHDHWLRHGARADPAGRRRAQRRGDDVAGGEWRRPARYRRARDPDRRRRARRVARAEDVRRADRQ